MVHYEESNVNKTQLPRLLPSCLLKLHLIKLSLSLFLTVMAIVCMCLYGVSGYVVVLGAGITSFFGGFFGSMANKLRSLVLHGGSVLVFALSFYMSLLAYVGTYAMITVGPSGNVIVVVITLLLLVLDMIFSALNGGVELIVIYVSESQRRLNLEEKRRGISNP